MSGSILVTGATGFLGRALVARLLGDGLSPAELRCLVRDRARALAAGLPEESLVDGDLADRDALARAAEGVGAVVHLAGLTRARRREELFAANENGVDQVGDAVARVAPGARFVLVSSLAAAGPSVDGRGTDATPDRCRPCSDYGASKLAGERRLLLHTPRLDWCVLRPPIVYGPGDEGTRMLFRQALAPVAVVPWSPRPLSLIHVDDVARAIGLAVGRRGVHGFLPLEGPERADTDVLPRAIADACGRRARLLRVPMVVPRVLAHLADAWNRIRNRASFFNSDKMREASAPGWVADPAPARRELGFEPAIAIAEGLRDTARAEGDVRP